MTFTAVSKPSYCPVSVHKPHTSISSQPPLSSVNFTLFDLLFCLFPCRDRSARCLFPRRQICSVISDICHFCYTGRNFEGRKKQFKTHFTLDSFEVRKDLLEHLRLCARPPAHGCQKYGSNVQLYKSSQNHYKHIRHCLVVSGACLVVLNVNVYRLI